MYCNNKDQQLWIKAGVSACQRHKIDTIVGPMVSGTMCAAAIGGAAALRGWPMTIMSLEKNCSDLTDNPYFPGKTYPKRRRRGHGVGLSAMPPFNQPGHGEWDLITEARRIAWTDDIVGGGDTLRESLRVMRAMGFSERPTCILISNHSCLSTRSISLEHDIPFVYILGE